LWCFNWLWFVFNKQKSRETLTESLLFIGAVLNTAKVEKGSRVAVFGLGAVGLAVIMVIFASKKKRI